MKDQTPRTVELKNYRKPDYSIPTIDLNFDLEEETTQVVSRMAVKCQYDFSREKRPLVLNGENLVLKKVLVNGEPWGPAKYHLGENILTLPEVPGPEFTLEIHNTINPSENKALEGLYKSGNVFCTQNEPEGFRRITYFLDRSDVLSRYSTRIAADKQRYPILLSNGNPKGSGDLPGGKHWVEWQDPFPKPCYLFALVAGNLGVIHDHFLTRSGRKIDLRLYCDKGNEDKCYHAMASLKKAMKWDEDVFNLEYDLDIYMIVAVDAFNMGAMENKGLNIFNTSCVLFNPKTATDADFHRVEGVVGHEYFHNWTGNRVTCRDWFQLTLKEGLTVFRDQEFSGDMSSRSVQRIKDVRSLRAGQFPEDGGPTAHPIRPESYIEINNFYTYTVYNKGAEVIRMVHTLLGDATFKKGIEKYFELYDGQAVTTEDFLHSMELAGKIDLTQFKRWYFQAGTPEVEVRTAYDEKNKTFKLTLTQHCPETPGQKNKLPFLIPFTVGLLDGKGREMPLTPDGQKTVVLSLSQKTQDFLFEKVPERPIPSLNRNFGAPIKLKAPLTQEELMFLLAHDQDPFNRWDAHQQLGSQLFHTLMEDHRQKRALRLPEGYLSAYRRLLLDETIDPAFKAMTLLLPDEGVLIEDFNPIPFEDIHQVRQFMVQELAMTFHETFLKLYNKIREELKQGGDLRTDQHSSGLRELKNVCLHYLIRKGDAASIQLCFNQFQEAANMTDEISALRELAHLEGKNKEREEALSRFYHKWKGDLLVMTKWFGVQAGSRRTDTLEQVKSLIKDPVFDIQIPNFVRSLILVFTQNYVQFNDPSGKGYEFLADMVLKIDPMNPTVASSLASGFNKYAKLDSHRRPIMKAHLERMIATPHLSKNVFEILHKNLGMG